MATTLTVNTTGSYYCTLEYSNTLLRTCPAHVSLAEFKPPSNAVEQTLEVFANNDIVLTSCQNVISVPPAIIEWRKDNKAARVGTPLVSGNLRISGTKFGKHAGTYQCIATNPVTGDSWTSPGVTVIERSKLCCML